MIRQFASTTRTFRYLPNRLLSHAFTTSSDATAELYEYLTGLGISEAPGVQKGMIQALERSFQKTITVSDLKQFGPGGLQALALSVEQQQKKHSSGRKKRPSRTVTFLVPHHQTKFDLQWKFGDSLLDVAQSAPDLLGEYMEGTCGGQMSCCTCHVYLDKRTFEALPEPEEAELDMLDIAYEPGETSRLGCQVCFDHNLEKKIGKDDAITVTIPAGVNNVWK